ncbi:hypothetical protein MXB_1900 [Myxobolus squamalis]|nr:hypothetical protein MXB_1900 [Myxobolus squamalis]
MKFSVKHANTNCYTLVQSMLSVKTS